MHLPDLGPTTAVALRVGADEVRAGPRYADGYARRYGRARRSRGVDRPFPVRVPGCRARVGYASASFYRLYIDSNTL